MKANPKAGMQVNWHMFPDAVPTNVPYDQALQAAVDNNIAYMSYINKQDGKWGFMPDGPLQQYIDYLGLTGKVDIHQWFSNEFIDFVNDFDEAAVIAQAKAYQAPTP
jgi:hypothetical protein